MHGGSSGLDRASAKTSWVLLTEWSKKRQSSVGRLGECTFSLGALEETLDGIGADDLDAMFPKEGEAALEAGETILGAMEWKKSSKAVGSFFLLFFLFCWDVGRGGLDKVQGGSGLG